jgi:hypothetical protein
MVFGAWHRMGAQALLAAREPRGSATTACCTYRPTFIRFMSIKLPRRPSLRDKRDGQEEGGRSATWRVSTSFGFKAHRVAQQQKLEKQGELFSAH